MSQHKKIPLLAAMILALLGLLFAGYWYLHGRYFESTDNAYLQSEVTGISSKLPGYIREVLVTDNQPVKAGQLIARLDDREYKTRVAEAEADLRLNQATAENLAATRTQQLSLIQQAEAKVASAKAEQLRASQQVNRISQLNQRHYSSQDSLDEVRAGLQVNQAQAREAQAALQAARERLLVLDAERKQNLAKLALSEAQLEQAKLELGYTELRAPADGIIGKRSLREGLYVQSGMQVASLVPLQQVWVARCLPGSTGRGDHRQPGPGHRCQVRPAATGECHWQLHQNRAAGTGEDPHPRARPAGRQAAAGSLHRSDRGYPHS
jgi:membrane fusion protein (multidrug efflux system)